MRSSIVVALLLAVGCSSSHPTSTSLPARTLRIGLPPTAASASDSTIGFSQLIGNITSEPLLLLNNDGRYQPVLVREWASAADGLTLALRLRDARFHDGTPMTAGVVRDLLSQRLPPLLGPAYDDVADIRADSTDTVTVALRQPSRFVLEALDIFVSKPDARLVGTGPFRVETADAPQDLVANRDYYDGPPGLERVSFRRYPSVRAAWADLLRGEVDMLYEVGVDALDSLEPSRRAKVFSFRRHYQFMLLFNIRRPVLRDASFRRSLAAAVDRPSLVEEGLAGRGVPSTGPVWPGHWAAPAPDDTPAFAPTMLAEPGRPLRLSCLVIDEAHERLAISLQRQLRSVGVDLVLDVKTPAQGLAQVSRGDYDVVLLEAISAPSLLRPYLFWHSKGPYNYGGFASQEVDTALDSIRHALDDDAYRGGVAAFTRAIRQDPPAIFLAWGERARAVSTAFAVPVDVRPDPLSVLRLWRPAADPPPGAGASQ